MVKHPAAKSMIEISRTQDEECGDGTTSVIILGISKETDNVFQNLIFIYRKETSILVLKFF